MSHAPTFIELQQRFSAHIRDPDSDPAFDNIEPRRLALYRELFYRNVESFMAKSFPVLRRISDDSAWHRLIADYFKEHRARTPYFPKMPQEFLHYLSAERDTSNDPPYLLELAHYEWLELEVSLDVREIDMNDIDPHANLLQRAPIINPTARAHSYRFAVHRIAPGHLPHGTPSESTHLVVYRDRDDKVRFMELNPVAARLLALVADSTQTPGIELLRRIAVELAHPDPQVVIDGGAETLQQFVAGEVVLGAKRGPERSAH